MSTRAIRLGLATGLTWLVAVGEASAVEPHEYAFPSTAEDYEHWYPTAYVDQGGVDWNCGDITYSGHIGSDFGGGSWAGMEAGRDVTAAADGVVTSTHDGEFDGCAGDCPDGGFGNVVWVRHVDGKQTVYAHLKTDSIAVVEGDHVECGDLLGQMGSSGNSTGPHLHFGVRTLAGTWADPFWGPCSGEPSWWVEQGEYGALPGLACADPPPECVAEDLVTCGASIDGNNAGPGSTDDHVFYGCDHDLISTGNEILWRFVTDLDEPVTVELSGLAADLDLYVLEGTACDTKDCVDVSRLGNTSDESITFDAVAGHEYAIAVDGYDEAASDFSLDIACAGQIPEDPPETEGTEPEETEPPETGETEHETEPTGDPPGDPTEDGSDDDSSGADAGSDSGCACHAASGSGGLLAAFPLLVGFALGARRRPGSRRGNPLR